MKKFESYFKKATITESLEYKDFFGKEVSHNEAIEKQLKGILIHIIMDDLKISEKSFTEVDKIIERVNKVYSLDFNELANEYYNLNKRLKLLAEEIYDKYFKPFNKGIFNESENYEDVIQKIKSSKKLSQEIKDKIIPLVVLNSTAYNKGFVTGLKFANSGCSLGANEDGFFVHTHRARSKSYSDIDKIPQKDINFIVSTG